jgi:EAL domain-containing protein (putative c-di-GMP-specific phosphodiesterase class I)
VMRNLNISLPVMTTLRGFGVRLAIDDFGTGYASLAHLKHIPADELKIDGSFIVDLDSDPRDRGVVKAMIEMSHALGMTVVAEGVETAAQLAILEDFGCDVIQGFLLARPVPPGDVSFDSARPG